MAIITHLIPSFKAEVLKSNISAILLDELSNQYSLSGNEDFNFSQIWVERKTGFNLSDIKAINLTCSDIKPEAKFSSNRHLGVMYYIDVFYSKKYEGENDGGQLAQDAAWNSANAIAYILEYPSYRDLGLKPHVMASEVKNIFSAKTKEDDSSMLGIVRIEYFVKYNTQIISTTYENIEAVDVIVKLSESDKGFYYELKD